MNKEELKELVESGHEIEFLFNSKKYSITYGLLKGKHIISFCEFYKETTEVETFDELCDVEREGVKVIDMITSITMNEIWIY